MLFDSVAQRWSCHEGSSLTHLESYGFNDDKASCIGRLISAAKQDKITKCTHLWSFTHNTSTKFIWDVLDTTSLQ